MAVSEKPFRLGSVLGQIGGYFTNSGRNPQNQMSSFAQAFFSLMSSQYTSYDPKDKTYLEEGFNNNADVFAILSQMATKTSSVPFQIKRIKNTNKAKELRAMDMVTKGALTTPLQYIQYKSLEEEAFEEILLPLPIDRPNPLQTWTEFWALGKVMLRMFGNAYMLMESPEEGPNQGQPKFVYWLPPDKIQIVVRSRIELMYDPSPIQSYMLRDAGKYASFAADDVIHFKLPNPNYDLNGSHLYGHSPLRAALDNIQSSNEAVMNNIRMLKNSGAFGIIYGKNDEPLDEAEAKQLKQRLKEMDDVSVSQRLSNIAGFSKELGFLRLSLTADELKPFDYLKFDQKQLCNVLSWSDKLLNNDDGGKYDNVKEFRKEVVVGNIMPDLEIFEDGLNSRYLPRYSNYKGAIWQWDASALPEMQADMKELAEWLDKFIANGTINRATALKLLGMPIDENDELLKVRTVSTSVMSLEDAVAEIGGEPILNPTNE